MRLQQIDKSDDSVFVRMGDNDDHDITIGVYKESVIIGATINEASIEQYMPRQELKDALMALLEKL